MATIPEDCLENLKCSACGYYLSCSPVYLKHNGDNLCGRCTVPHDEEHLIIRNNSYETVASVMVFPCKYKTVGCSKQLAWAKVKYHEEGCEYRPYNCPTSDCNWSGLHCNLKQHYEENHVNLLLEHPANVKPNITKDSEKRYLLSAFGLLFILHLKYIVSSSKLWYCVRFLGNTQFASFFEYILEITTGDNGIIRMKKTVQPTNTDVLNQHTSIEININHLLGMGVISNFDDAVFNISVKLNNNKCMICNNDITSSVKLSSEGCFCGNCEIEEAMDNVLLPVQKQTVVPCKNANAGCIYQDIPLNMPKHEKWLCKLNKGTCQLTSDLFISTLNLTKLGTAWHKAIIPAYGPNPFDNTAEENCVACELFLSETYKVVVMQLRSSIEPKMVSLFLNDLKSYIDEQNFKQVIILTSSFSYEMKNLNCGYYRYLTNTEELSNVFEENGIQPVEDSQSNRIVIHGSGFAVKLYELLKASTKTTVIVKYASEGDNRPDAMSMLHVLQKCLQLTTDVLKQISFPLSWELVYGSPPPLGIY
ncbi:uncharacterized protein CBL_11257 [Carabus blaptoides fortunei]